MHRRSLALLIACLLSSTAHAEGGDIIVVEPNPVIATQAANTNAEHALTPRNRTLLLRMVSYGCTRKARQMPQFLEMAKQSGKDDVAANYCQCITGEMIDRLNKETIKTIIKTRKPDPAFQQAMVPVAQACIEQATN